MQSSSNHLSISLSTIGEWPGATPRVVLGGEVSTALCLRVLHGNLTFEEVHSAGLLLLRSASQLAEVGTDSVVHAFANVQGTPVYAELKAIDDLVNEYSDGTSISRERLRDLVRDVRWNQLVNAASVAVCKAYPALATAVGKRSVV